MSEKTLNSANAMDAERATKTLRDEIAIEAMKMHYDDVKCMDGETYASSARRAYQMADAMMEARNAKA